MKVKQLSDVHICGCNDMYYWNIEWWISCRFFLRGTYFRTVRVLPERNQHYWNHTTVPLTNDNTVIENGAYHITLYSKDSVCQTLYCYPFHRHFGYSALPVVITTVDLLRQTKVCHTHCHIITQPVREARNWFFKIPKNRLQYPYSFSTCMTRQYNFSNKAWNYNEYYSGLLHLKIIVASTLQTQHAVDPNRLFTWCAPRK